MKISYLVLGILMCGNNLVCMQQVDKNTQSAESVSGSCKEEDDVITSDLLKPCADENGCVYQIDDKSVKFALHTMYGIIKHDRNSLRKLAIRNMCKDACNRIIDEYFEKFKKKPNVQYDIFFWCCQKGLTLPIILHIAYGANLLKINNSEQNLFHLIVLSRHKDCLKEVLSYLKENLTDIEFYSSMEYLMKSEDICGFTPIKYTADLKRSDLLDIIIKSLN